MQRCLSTNTNNLSLRGCSLFSFSWFMKHFFFFGFFFDEDKNAFCSAERKVTHLITTEERQKITSYFFVNAKSLGSEVHDESRTYFQISLIFLHFLLRRHFISWLFKSVDEIIFNFIAILIYRSCIWSTATCYFDCFILNKEKEKYLPRFVKLKW